MNNRTLAIMGDCHSQHHKVQEALNWLESEYSDYHLICLGDIFDSRLDDLEKNYSPYSDPIVVYQIFKQLTDNGHVLLQSNHQDKLKRWLSHDLAGTTPNPVKINYGLQYTLEQFVQHMTIEEKKELHDWLSILPYHVVIQGYDQLHDSEVSFLCSHAYFNAYVNLQNPSRQHKQQALYGVLNPDNTRLDWWSSDQAFSFYGLPAIRVAGHYHVLAVGKHQRVIDTGCGNTGGSLCVHVPAYDIYKEF